MRPSAPSSPFETPAAKPLPAPQGEDAERESRFNESEYWSDGASKRGVRSRADTGSNNRGLRDRDPDRLPAAPAQERIEQAALVASFAAHFT
jgi:hypothetical protein